MPLRPNMQPLIDLLREKGSARSTDEFGGVTYWDDQQLQDILDGAKTRKSVGGTIDDATETIYMPAIPKLWFADPDTVKMRVSGTWTTAPDGAWDTLKRELTTSQEVEAINAEWISLNQALADLWEMKAAQRSDYVNIKGGQNKLDMQQEYDHCVKMSMYYRARIWVRWQT
jgi:hypothetical protein